MNLLYNREQIIDKVRDLAINIHFKHYNDNIPIIFIGILNGAFMFFSDLMKEIHLDNIECDFVKVKSYEGKEKKDLIIFKNIELSLENKHVYIVDDIYDTGETINYLYNIYKNLNPKSISAITLIKRENSPVNANIELKSAFTIDADEWVYGYGMDDSKGYNRNLPYILVEQI
jgi:hypoxanthine phosphoribosyltransferase